MDRIELSFGHHRCDGTPLPNAQIIAAEHQALTFFSQAFGGAQVYVCHRTGVYHTSDGQLTIEPASVVWSFASEVDDHLTQLLWSLASSIAQALDQEFVLLAITHLDGILAFIAPTSSVQLVHPLHEGAVPM